jgi:hypothetical protein
MEILKMGHGKEDNIRGNIDRIYIIICNFFKNKMIDIVYK